MKIDELYFGVVMLDPNHDFTLTSRNLFDLGGIRTSIALWLTTDEATRQSLGFAPLPFCFGGVRRRAEYEVYLAPIYRDTPSLKVDLYDLYVLPNQEYLLSLIEPLTKEDGKKWLKKHKR